MQEEEIIYRIALTSVPGIGHYIARVLLSAAGSARDVFKMPAAKLEKIEGIGKTRASNIKAFKDFSAAEREYDFCRRKDVRILSITDPAYPKRLLHCDDGPFILYTLGSADLNASKMIAIVGTRNNTDHGRQVTESLTETLSAAGATIVSGLAFGIDTIAHKIAVKEGAPTIGVVGHGIDTIYPAQNRPLAKEMLENGGAIITEFPQGTKPDKQNFPSRNRIVAGMTDATIIVESNINGGSMITAVCAGEYNRDVFAIPGRFNDAKSSGCNDLIKQNLAALITSGEDVIKALGWNEKSVAPKKQRALFTDLSPEQKTILDLFENVESLHVDEIAFKTGMTQSALAQSLLFMEMENLIRSLPGKMYRAN